MQMQPKESNSSSAHQDSTEQIHRKEEDANQSPQPLLGDVTLCCDGPVVRPEWRHCNAARRSAKWSRWPSGDDQCHLASAACHSRAHPNPPSGGVRHKWEPIDVAADLDAKVLRLSALGATKRDALQGMTHDSTGKRSSDGCSRCRVLPTLRPTRMMASTTPKPHEFVCWCSTSPSLPVRVSRNVAKGVSWNSRSSLH
jgi:hypothetical protein